MIDLAGKHLLSQDKLKWKEDFPKAIERVLDDYKHYHLVIWDDDGRLDDEQVSQSKKIFNLKAAFGNGRLTIRQAMRRFLPHVDIKEKRSPVK